MVVIYFVLGIFFTMVIHIISKKEMTYEDTLFEICFWPIYVIVHTYTLIVDVVNKYFINTK